MRAERGRLETVSAGMAAPVAARLVGAERGLARTPGLGRGLSRRHERVGLEVRHLEERLRAASPYSILDRGYAVVTDAGGSVVHRAGALAAGGRPHDPLRAGPRRGAGDEHRRGGGGMSQIPIDVPGDEPRDPEARVAADSAAGGPSVEERLRRLEAIVQKLESEAVSLDESIALFEEGVELAVQVRKRLEASEGRIKRIVERSEGLFSLEDFDLE
jgi:exodeoxyribonuclease VII small subunit